MLTIQQLRELLVLQKHYHELTSERPKFTGFIDEIHQQYLESCEHFQAPPLANSPANTPEIDYLFLKPKAALTQSTPLIIHTHGGPNNCMSKVHAETAYFLSMGCAVACPNYRGSTPAPTVALNAWEKVDHNLLKIYGPMDVIAVTQDVVHRFPFIDSTKIILRGGSFGSLINSHLIRQIQQGVYPPLFCAVHFSGGIEYPELDVPNIPVLFTHGIKDETAPFQPALTTMELLLLKQIESKKPCTVETLITKEGDHHLIPPFDKMDETLNDLDRYVHLFYDFYNSVLAGNFVAREPSVQIHYLHQSAKTPLQQTTLPTRLLLRAETAKWQTPQIQLQKLLQTETAPERLSPSETMLKLVLGGKFKGDLREDVTQFLGEHVKPFDYIDDMKPLPEAGKEMLADTTFTDQIVEIVDCERATLQQRPTDTVWYHAADEMTLYLYTMIELWRKALQNDLQTPIQALTTLRFSEIIKNACTEINSFLNRMESLNIAAQTNRFYSNPETSQLNYTNGFPDQAIACNFSLFSNFYDTSSFSLYWYFCRESVNKNELLENALMSILAHFGFDARGRVARYATLFSTLHANNIHNKVTQNVLLQFFIPQEMTNRYAYLCQIYGTRFKDRSLENPENIRQFLANPVQFEKDLAAKKKGFVYDKAYGNTILHFEKNEYLFTPYLQARIMSQALSGAPNHTYVRNPVAFQQFLNQVFGLIQQDFADFIAANARIENFDFKVNQEFISRFKKQFGIAGTPRYQDDYIFMHQMHLRMGSTEYSNKDFYRVMMADVSAESKFAMQYRMYFDYSPLDVPYVYSLCLYLGGFTYYELLMNAINAVLVPNTQQRTELQNFIDKYSGPNQPEGRFDFDEYNRCTQALMRATHRYQMPTTSLQFFAYPAPKIGRNEKPKVIMVADNKKQDYLRHELELSINYILRRAKICKDTADGRCVEPLLLKTL